MTTPAFEPGTDPHSLKTGQSVRVRKNWYSTKDGSPVEFYGVVDKLTLIADLLYVEVTRVGSSFSMPYLSRSWSFIPVDIYRCTAELSIGIKQYSCDQFLEPGKSSHQFLHTNSVAEAKWS